MDFSPPTGTVKEEGRGEKKFRAFKAGSCLSLFVPFTEKDSNFTILFNSNLKIF
jgi:hypothetical protein